MKLLKKLVLICAISVLSYGNSIDKIEIMTEEFPPYNMEKDGKLSGFAIDILELMLKESGSKQTRKDFAILPWARSYHMVQNKPNTMLFSMYRTKKREKLFKWVGPIDSSIRGLIAKKERNIKIDSLEDLKKYKIGTVKDDATDIQLRAMNVKNLDTISGTDSIGVSIKKLDLDRIDLFGYVYEMDSWNLKNFNPDDYELVYVLKKDDLCYAFHKDTDDKIITKLQNSLDALKEKGTVKKIISKYK